MSNEVERKVVRLEALLVQPEPEEWPETDEMAWRAADEISEYFLERDGREIDPDALADVYLAGRLEAVEMVFDVETSGLMGRLIKCSRRPDTGYAQRVHLCDEDL